MGRSCYFMVRYVESFRKDRKFCVILVPLSTSNREMTIGLVYGERNIRLVGCTGGQWYTWCMKVRTNHSRRG